MHGKTGWQAKSKGMWQGPDQAEYLPTCRHACHHLPCEAQCRLVICCLALRLRFKLQKREEREAQPLAR